MELMLRHDLPVRNTTEGGGLVQVDLIELACLVKM